MYYNITAKKTALFGTVVILFCIILIFPNNEVAATASGNDMNPGVGDYPEEDAEAQSAGDSLINALHVILVIGIIVEVFFIIKWIITINRDRSKF